MQGCLTAGARGHPGRGGSSEWSVRDVLPREVMKARGVQSGPHAASGAGGYETNEDTERGTREAVTGPAEQGWVALGQEGAASRGGAGGCEMYPHRLGRQSPG